MLRERKRKLARTLLLAVVTSRHLSVFPSRCVRTYVKLALLKRLPLLLLSILFHPVWLARRVTNNSRTANAIKSNPLVDLERAALIVAARSRLVARVAVGCSVVVVVGAGESPAHTRTVRLVEGTCRPLGIVFHRAPRPQHRRETALGIGAGQ
uniref:Uncharacterized protein n=1 Tax=Ixodes ricinus TaxID=34613 RepID=A0A6B0UX61_IXORI